MNEHELAEQHRLDEASIYLAIWIDRLLGCLPFIVLVAAVIVAVKLL